MPATIREFLQRLRFRILGRKFDHDLEEEMRLHLDLRADGRIADGMSQTDADAAARRHFGNVTLLQERSREAWGWTFFDRLRQDVRYGLRALAAQPGFTITALLSLALGIGANTAIFSIINAVMLRSLPVEDPNALVQVQLGQGGDDEVNTPIWEQFQEKQRAFSGVLAYSPTQLDLTQDGQIRHLQGISVSGDFFRVLGVPAVMGRAFTATDDRWGGGPDGAVAVISYDFWKAHFNGDSSAIGKTVRLDRQSFIVVGITPPWFRGLDVDHSYDVAIPIGSQPILIPGAQHSDEVHHWWLRIVGRMAPGERLNVAQERVTAVTPEILRATVPTVDNPSLQSEYLKSKFFVQPAALGFSESRVHYRTALFVLMAISGLVLLTACANIANLLLARGAARQRELSVRMAIGASRVRVIRQLMTESLILALTGAAGGFLLALWGGRALLRILSTAGNPIDIPIAPDLRLLGFTALIAVSVALLFGLAPSMRSTRLGLNSVLKENDRGALLGTSRLNFSRVLVGGQIALSMLLLVAAGLFVGTFRNLLAVDTGFDRHGVLLMDAGLDPGSNATQRAASYREILARLRTVPGVSSAAYSVLTPITHAGWAQITHPEGYVAKSERDTLVFLNRVSSDYFRTMRTPLLAGREFDEHDTAAAPGAIIISESTAHAFFANENPIGKTMGLGRPGSEEPYRIIGVVKDTKYNRLNEQTRKIAYVAAEQDKSPAATETYAIRSSGDPESLVSSIRTALATGNGDVVFEFRTLNTQVEESLLQPRMVAILSSTFGSLALLLAIVGLYGITTYSVARRKAEIGIRIALGAQRGSVLWLVMKEVAVLLAIGMPLGWAASAGAGRLVTSLLYGVRSTALEPLILGALILTLATSVAAFLPARRASKLDPLAALREE
ncbi:MAG TPA: ABC transporter permease [Bryobacteraceae bacterium]|jgi:predicted permease